MEEDTLELSLQKAPKEGFMRLLAFDVSGDQEMMLTHFHKFKKEEFLEILDILEDCIKENKDLLLQKEVKK